MPEATGRLLRRLRRQERPVGRGRGEVRAAVLLDAWATRSLDPEWEQLPVLPRTARRVLRSRPQLLLVQASAVRASAWTPGPGEGVDGPSAALRDLVARADRAGVATVLWLGEPDAWEHEVATARLFRTVLTVDPASVARLRGDLGHDRVHVMAHAAQPRWENPAVPAEAVERRAVCVGAGFGDEAHGPDAWLGGLVGMRKEYRPQLVTLEPDRHPLGDVAPVVDDDLAVAEPVVERRHGLRHTTLGPGRLVPFLRGHELVLARGGPGAADLDLRVAVTATAAGLAVAVPPRPALEAQHGGRLTPVPEGEAGTDALRTLLDSPELRDRVAHRARRDVLAHHTWAHRVDLLRRLHGLPVPARRAPVSVVVTASRAHHLARVVQLVGAQTHPDLELVVLDRRGQVDEADLAARARKAGLPGVRLVHGEADEPQTDSLLRAVSAGRHETVALLEDSCHYGPHFLQDMLAARAWTGDAVLGKRTHYVHLVGPGATVLAHPGQEHRDVEDLEPGTLVLARALLLDLLQPPDPEGEGPAEAAPSSPAPDDPAPGGPAPAVAAAGDDAPPTVAALARGAGHRLHALDRFGFLRRRTVRAARAEETLPHAVVQFYGPGETHVDV